MKTLFCLLAALAVAPLAAYAQSNPYGVDPNSQVAANQRAEEALRQQQQQTQAMENQRSQSTGTGGGGSRQPFFRAPRYGQMFTGKTADERHRNRQIKQADADRRAREAEKAARNGVTR